MTRPLFILALLLAAIVGCVRTIDLNTPDPDASPIDAFDPIPDAHDVDAEPIPDAEVDADLSPDAS